MPVESEKYTDVAYQIIASVSQTHGCKKHVVYGIKAEYAGETTEMLKVRDISVHKSNVLRLILLLNECDVTRDHLIDIIEDYVQEL